MALRLATNSRNSAVDAVAARANGGKIRVYTGSQPASADDAATGTLLVEFDLQNPAFGAASNGQAALAGVPISAAAIASGTAGWFRMLTSGGGSVLDGAVGQGSGDLSLDNTNIATGQTVRITSLTLSQPAS